MSSSALHRLATGGLVTTAAAERAGFDRRQVARAASRGEITRVRKGWYAAPPVTDREVLHRLRTIACATDNPFAAVGHHSGLVLRGLPTFRADLSLVHLCRPGGARQRRKPGLVLWGAADLSVETLDVDGHQVAALPVATCVVQSGLSTGPECALVAADVATRQGLLGGTALDDELAAHAGRPGITTLRTVLDWTDPRHESVGESRTAYALRRLGYAFTPQVRIGPWRVDFVIDGTRVVVEFDGAVKYETRDDLLAEKRREDDIRSRGYVVVRVRWSDLYQPEVLAARLAQAIQQAA